MDESGFEVHIAPVRNGGAIQYRDSGDEQMCRVLPEEAFDFHENNNARRRMSRESHANERNRLNRGVNRRRR